MQALQLHRPRFFTSVDIPSPSIDAGNSGRILVKLRWALVCASDISKFAGTDSRVPYPLAPGKSIHECVGQVIASTSAAFSPGDWVVAIPEEERGLGEFYVALESKAIRLVPELVGCDASVLIQPLSTVVYGMDQLGNVAEKSVMVVGLGPIGLLFCWLFKQRGARSIVGVDPSRERCEMAARLGANTTFPMSGANLVEMVHQQVQEWQAPDIVVEAVGHQPQTINDCINLVRYQGTILAFGVPDQDTYPLEFEIFFRRNARLIAAVTPDWSKYLPLAHELFRIHRGELEPLVTHRFPIRESQQAFTLYENHAPGMIKALLDASVW